MNRRNFYDIIKNSPFNLRAEYSRIYTLYYKGTEYNSSIVEMVDNLFPLFPESFRGRTISRQDFDITYGFFFPETPVDLEVTELISLCEYVWNFCNALLKFKYIGYDDDFYKDINHMISLIKSCIDDINHTFIVKKELVIIVPKSGDVIAVSEIVSKEIAISILEYHHHSLKGNLPKKLAILKLMADDIEHQRSTLNSINKTFTSNLYNMLNKFVRHNNNDNPYINGLSPDELEACYDDIYQMWLLAKLEIDNLDRKKRVEEVLSKINT